jgi:glutaredoxin
MLQLLGKTYSIETNLTKTYLDSKGIVYDYIDLEEDPDWMLWFKYNQIIALPALRVNHRFCVGFDRVAIDNLIESLKKD